LEKKGVTAYALDYEEMLWHICQHMIQGANVFSGTRLIWVADIVSFAEKFIAKINWEKVKKQYPLILNVLSLVHFMTPLSASLQAQASLKIGHEPQGIGVDFQGWPRSSLSAQRHKGYWRILQDSFFPSEWWLRLHYGLESESSLFWYRWVRHPLDILGWIKQLLGERMRDFNTKRLSGRTRR